MIGGPGELTGTAIAHHPGMTRALSDQLTHSVQSMGDLMSFTSAPPRRDLHELEQSISTVPTKSAAEQGGFLVPANRRIRIGADNEARRIQIYNADYMSDGTRYAHFDKPWTVFTPINFRAFKTHHEALTWALEEARK